MKIHNFSAGPSILANTVINQASKSVLDLDEIGLSVLEISHRSNEFKNIINEAQTLIKELLQIPKNYEVLFLQGGASLQFYMSALNFSKKNGFAGYIDTGVWSQKAIQEASKITNVITVASSKDNNYTYIPKKINIKKRLDYLHFTSNNTIYGTQFHSLKEIQKASNNTKLICDMSSDILSKKINIQEFDLIYAGAQKNLGPAGATLIIINRDSLEINQNLPTYLNYKTHIEKKSMFNTPPVFPIYVILLTLRWIKQNGGIDMIEKNNTKKASAIYNEIDRNKLFFGLVNSKDRSIMNATFNITKENLKIKFETMCKEAGISGIIGHRSVGGYRASLYNALNIDSVNHLVDVMQKLEKQS